MPMTTARQVYEAVLVETNKVNAPALLLEDFNYLINKAINQYVNKRYNIYDTNQQTTDDLRVLKSSVKLSAPPNSVEGVTAENSLYGAVYEFILPYDYLHILNCVCNFRVTKPFKCYNANTYVQFGATRLTSDMWSQIINNFYLRPTYKRPYYYIHNVNVNTTKDNTKVEFKEVGREPNDKINIPTDPGNTDVIRIDYSRDESGNPIKSRYGTSYVDNKNEYDIQREGISRTITFNNNGNTIDFDATQKVGELRYGNASPVRLEIRYGKDNSIFQLDSIYIDYIKTPQYVNITQEQLDLTEDTSQIMEFPDYVIQEIINELVHIVMENAGDPRLQSHIPISQSIANPTQQQEQPRRRG